MELKPKTIKEPKPANPKVKADYHVEVGVFETGFVYVKTRIDGKPTNVSIDVLLGAMMTSILGSVEAMRNWVSGRAAVLSHGNEPYFENGVKKKRVSLSRLVQREILRFIALPSEQDFKFVRSIGRAHPLDMHGTAASIVPHEANPPVNAEPVVTVAATDLDHCVD